MTSTRRNEDNVQSLNGQTTAQVGEIPQVGDFSSERRWDSTGDSNELQ
ncbi:hypothetical protein [Halorussus halophilus]|nr:hypothetical protein [Halorussus halophilus]